MEKVKVDLENRSMENMWLVRIMFSYEKGAFEWNKARTTVVFAFFSQARHVDPHLRMFQHEKTSITTKHLLTLHKTSNRV